MKCDTHIVTLLPFGITPNFEGLKKKKKVILTFRIWKLYLLLAAQLTIDFFLPIFAVWIIKEEKSKLLK